jgi:aminopeptidase N
MSSATASDRDILPGTIKPINYDISLYDLELGGQFSYQGTVKILSKIVTSSNQIVLNSHQLKIHSADVFLTSTKTEHTYGSVDISYDAPRQRATITFGEDLPVSDKATLVIKFQGTINNDMAGFYRSKYKPAVTPAPSVAKDGESHVMFSTQFESCDARRAFPCFDEPNLKATFDFEIELPEDQVALSNMPEKETKGSKAGFKVVSFEKTPIMSTYLLAWAVGDFEYIEDFTKRKYGDKNLPVRVYTTRGLKSQGQFALDHAPKIVDFFSDIFGIEYPLPKCDLLAVHEFSHGAMENWGLITYRTTAVLFDEKTSDTKFKNRIAYVVAHELAHQWFGNLVTMDWWNELWLNEGFATWVGWLATDHLHPSWHVWPQFVSDGMQTAFTLDSLRSSHPIEVPVKDALDVDQIFDSISYLKGSSVIRMLATHLGEDVFLRGVGNYLKAHAYGNAKTHDLWSALSESSGQDVPALMGPWIQRIGFPVVTVTEEPGQINIKQSRYLSTGDVKPEEDSTTWWVPLELEGKVGPKGITHQIAFTKKEDTVRDIDDSFYKINKDNAGFYRTNYPPARLAKLGTQVGQLTLSDKIGLIGDAGALALSGGSVTTGLLSFVEGFQAEPNYLVWSSILGSLGLVKSVFSEYSEISEGLKKFTLKLISPAVEKIGWESSPSDDFLTSQLRAALILTAGVNGHEKVVAEAKSQFAKYIGGDKSAIHPALRGAVWGISIRHGAKSEYDALKKEWFTTTSIDGKEIALRALGRIQDQSLLPDFLDFLFKDVAVQDMHTGASALAANPSMRHGLWKYIQENFDPIKERLGKNMVVLDRFLKMSLNKFNDRKTEQEIASFFEGKDNRGYDRTLNVVSDTIIGRATYKERDEKIILEWLKANSYA